MDSKIRNGSANHSRRESREISCLDAVLNAVWIDNGRRGNSKVRYNTARYFCKLNDSGYEQIGFPLESSHPC